MYRNSPLNITNVIVMLVFFAGPVLVFFVEFNWLNVGLCVANFIWFGLSSSLFYHRVVTHGAAKLNPVVEVIFLLGGSISLSGGAINWAAIHRFHHSNPDVDIDPHSPIHGRFWAYLGWTTRVEPKLTIPIKEKICQDLLANRLYKFFDHKAMFILPTLIYVGSVYLLFGIDTVVWAFVLAGFLSYNFHWMLIASMCHKAKWGYRRFNTKDQSVNISWLSYLTFGESLHNNHHEKPNSINLRSSFWEADFSYLFVRFLEKLGLAKDLNVTNFKEIEK